MKQVMTLGWGLLVLAALCCAGTPPLPVINTSVILDVTNAVYAGGALGNGVSNSAAAIQAAINAATVTNVGGIAGATVRIPAAGTLSTYLCGPINLASHVNLQVDTGAMLRMLPYANWPGTTTFINAGTLTDVEISGTGTIDGNAGFSTGGVTNNWWQSSGSQISRPNFIQFIRCTRSLIKEVTLQNAPTFHLMLKNNNVSLTVQNIKISTPSNSPNTDGMDLGSSNVLIYGCSISTGDDNIQIGSSAALCSDITITNCTFGSGHGLSIGSPTQSGINNLIVSNCVWNGTQHGIKIKTDRGIGGLIENLKYLDLTMSNINFAIEFYTYYNSVGSPSSSFNVNPFRASTDTVHTVAGTTPIIRNIIISNLTATALGGNIAGIIWGLPEMLISNITLSKVNISAPTKTFDIYNARAIKILDSNLTAPNTSTNTLTLYNAGLIITNSTTTTTNFTMVGLNPTNGNNSFVMFGRPVSLNSTNVLGPNPLLTLGNSKLTVSNSLKLGSSSVLGFALGTNLAQIAATGSLTAGGTLNISNGGGLTNTTYTLITYGGGLTYNGLTLGPIPSTNFTYVVSTNAAGQINLIVGLATTFPQWQLQYFSCTNCPQADGTNDFDGDGLKNMTEFLAGSDPTNSASAWRVQANPTNGLPPVVVNFSENSTGLTITNRVWSFGDGGTATGSAPSHTYTSQGNFTVTMTIFNYFGTASLVASNLIAVLPEAVWTNANASGNWSTSTSWSPLSVPDNGANAVFATAGATAVVDNVSRTISGITFNRNANFVVSASGGASLMINNGITVTTNFTYTVSAPVVLAGTNIWSVASNGTLRVTGPIGGANSITKTGAGELIVCGTNNYSGETTISNGALQVTGEGLITNTPTINVASGATLDFSGRAGGGMALVSGQTLQGEGTVAGTPTQADGSVLSPGGNSVGTLTFLNDLIVSNAAVLQYDLGTNSDLAVVSSNLTLGGTLNINDAGGFGPGVYTLFTYGGTLTYNGVTIGTVPTTNLVYVIDTNTAGQVRLNVAYAPVTITVGAGDFRDRFGNLMPASGVAALVVDTGTNGFVDPQPSFPLSLGTIWGADDKIIGLWSLTYVDDVYSYLYDQTVVVYTNGIAPGQTLQLYWFPSLTLASNTVGVTYYGKYTDTNSPPLDGSGVWQTPASGSSVEVDFLTQSEGGSNPDAAGRATFLTTTPPVASFTANPTSGTEPLAVSFTDTSTGSLPLALSWDLGDSSTTNTTSGATFTHTYGPGTYTVTLVASNSVGTSTLLSNNLITVITAFQGWQLQYLACTNCPEAQGNADPDGDGMSNTNEFMAGTDPTSSASALRIISESPQSPDMVITWTTAGGRTNVVQATAGDGSGNYTNSFADLPSSFTIITGSGDQTTNYTESGGATNVPSRYYRVRLVP